LVPVGAKPVITTRVCDELVGVVAKHPPRGTSVRWQTRHPVIVRGVSNITHALVLGLAGSNDASAMRSITIGADSCRADANALIAVLTSPPILTVAAICIDLVHTLTAVLAWD